MIPSTIQAQINSPMRKATDTTLEAVPIFNMDSVNVEGKIIMADDCRNRVGGDMRTI